ncbi:MAG TPA: DUF3108 domain-containing protein, partial [Candidatus Deferrimicrobiaceae bacterium]|nr:DUF3108 domain-containing protein [Candidatus Deferrimicrobiaceae bacterium]
EPPAIEETPIVEETPKTGGTPAAVPEAAEPAAPVAPTEPSFFHATDSREPVHHAPETSPAAPKAAAPPAAGQAAAPRPSPLAHPEGEPAWARGPEVLVYRIGFLGMTVGYARFTYMGKSMLRGKEAYRLNVQAWTTGILTLIYKGETIDYYLDVRTLAPLQQEFTHRENKRDDVAIYEQESGRIVYRYKDSGEIHKQVDVTPNVYDPVSVAYYFRARDLGAVERPRPVYAGRKMWQISSRLVGREKIDTSGGPRDTVVIQPVIMREGKIENKGDLRMWMSNEPRHVPVRLYAKFKKIREWTLVAELLPPGEGG